MARRRRLPGLRRLRFLVPHDGSEGGEAPRRGNLDRSAPIFQHAELGVVGDLFEVLPALYALLAPGKPKGGDEQ